LNSVLHSFETCLFEYIVERARCEFLAVIPGNRDDLSVGWDI